MLKGVRRYTAFDFAVFKVCLVVIGLRLATMIPWFTRINPWIYGALWFVCGGISCLENLQEIGISLPIN
jgi:hypothetical protein